MHCQLRMVCHNFIASTINNVSTTEKSQLATCLMSEALNYQSHLCVSVHVVIVAVVVGVSALEILSSSLCNSGKE